MRWTELRELAGVRRRQLGMRLHDWSWIVRRPLAAMWARRAELAVFLAAAGGWAAITHAIGRLVRPDVVWPISLGLFLLSLCGWRLLYTVADAGLYTLTREGKPRG